MHLPRPVYENLPFIYFAVSGYLLFFFDGWHLVLPAIIFYSAACIILVARSANRRRDKLKKHNKSYPLPTLLYEYSPYLYMATALFMIIVSNTALFQFIAFVIVVIALRNLVCRHNNRM